MREGTGSASPPAESLDMVAVAGAASAVGGSCSSIAATPALPPPRGAHDGGGARCSLSLLVTTASSQVHAPR
jgi:hypothetical protein